MTQESSGRTTLSPRTIVVMLTFLAAMAPAVSMPPEEDSTAWMQKVAPSVLHEADAGVAEFLVVFEDHADLSAARAIEGRTERVRYVYETLHRVASSSQAALIEDLTARDVEYQAFWITNMVRVRAGRDTLESVSRRDDVARVDANPQLSSKLPVLAPDPGLPEPAVDLVGWNVSNVHADQVWNLGYTGAGIVVAGQDTGYQWDHPALKRAYRGWDGAFADHDYNWHDAIHQFGGRCGSDSLVPCDDGTHGTHTMGTILGDDGSGNQIGVAPGARWIGCRNMDEGIGTPATYTECFEWFLAPTDLAGENPDPARAPHVISNSWYCPPEEGCNLNTLRAIVAAVRAAGIVVVFSAGNDGPQCGTAMFPPAMYETVLSVGATHQDGSVASFSSRGPVSVDGSYRPKPDVTAPGVSVRSSIPTNGYGFKSGTSMASPHVTGGIALLLSARPDLIGKVEDVEWLVRHSAAPRSTTQVCGVAPGVRPDNVNGYGAFSAHRLLTVDADGDGIDNLGDCGPANATVYQGALDVCDGIDNDCDGASDEELCETYDADADGRVDAVELAWIGRAFGACSLDPTLEWWAAVDFNTDGCIDGDDLAILGGVWTCTAPGPLCS